MQSIDQFEQPLTKVKGKNLYKINKNQYLKINKRGNGEIVAPAKDPITKQTNWHNIIFTGGTVWGLIKVIIIVAFLLFLLWRYNVEVRDCLEIREHYNTETGCIEQDYFINQNIQGGNNGGISLSSLAESNDKQGS